MKIIPQIVLLTCLWLGKNPQAQVTVAIGDFRNISDVYFLDSWERSVPEFLKSELSHSEKIVIVERQQLETVLQEQALSMTGLIDSTTAQKVGQLLGAEFVLSGTINQTGKWTRIDAKLIRVSNGQIKSEKVQAPDQDHLTEMVALLGNNLKFSLAGEGRYQQKITLTNYPTTYFLGATVGLGVATLIINNAYNKKLDAYQQASRLSEFDDTYDAANTLHKTRTVFLALTGVAVVGTIYCLIQNLSPQEITAFQNTSSVKYRPTIGIDKDGGIYASVQISF